MVKEKYDFNVCIKCREMWKFGECHKGCRYLKELNLQSKPNKNNG